MPFADEWFKLHPQVVFRGEIGEAQAVALEKTAPVFDLIHPRTMHGCEVPHKPRMRGEPAGDVLAMMRTDMVSDQMNPPAGLSHLLIQVFQEGDAFRLPLVFITLAIDLARTGMKGRKDVEGTSACVLGLIAIGPVLRLRWPGQ